MTHPAVAHFADALFGLGLVGGGLLDPAAAVVGHLSVRISPTAGQVLAPPRRHNSLSVSLSD